jgi:hypothetical protein
VQASQPDRATSDGTSYGTTMGRVEFRQGGVATAAAAFEGWYPPPGRAVSAGLDRGRAACAGFSAEAPGATASLHPEATLGVAPLRSTACDYAVVARRSRKPAHPTGKPPKAARSTWAIRRSPDDSRRLKAPPADDRNMRQNLMTLGRGSNPGVGFSDRGDGATVAWPTANSMIVGTADLATGCRKPLKIGLREEGST